MIQKCSDDYRWYILSVIVDHNLGSKVLKIARQSGITGGTIIPAHGTMGDYYPKWFEGYESRKEIVLMISSEPIVDNSIDQLKQIMKLNKPNHGIIFTISVSDLLGSAYCRMSDKPIKEGVYKVMQQAIFVVVDKGLAELVVKSAETAGARGATVINGRGAGVHETSKLFSMEIEPEKEIVLIIAKVEFIDAITNAINEFTQMDKPGKGILFVVDIQKSYGLFD
ncbi:MAG: P-II family nitrogen regulator [Saccharofermentanales bacterium]